MSVKPWVAFTTTLPDDQVEDAGEIVTFGGRNVAIMLGGMLTELGCHVEEPYYAELDGWEFLLTYKPRYRFWCRVISFHPGFHLLFDNFGGRPTAAKDAAHAELALKLAAALKAAPQFHDISWWSLKEGPPEPQEISSAVVKKPGREDPASPISSTRAAGGRPAWGCLGLALFVTLGGVLSLVMFFAGVTPMPLGQAIFCGASLIVVGSLGFLRAWEERVET